MRQPGESDLQVQQAPTMRQPKRWPLANTLDSRSTDLTKDAVIINGYAEKHKITGDYQVEKRPGFSPNPVVTTQAGGLGGSGVPLGPAGGGAGIYTYTQYARFVGQISTTLYILGPPGGPNT